MKKCVALIRPIPVFAILVLITIGASVVKAQSGSPSPTPEPSPAIKSSKIQTKPSAERHFFSNVLHDQGTIWTAPFHLDRQDTHFVAPVALAAAVLISTDRHTANSVDAGGSLQPASHAISWAGSGYGAGSTAALFYLVGRWKGNPRSRETGLLAAEALIDSSLVVGALKLASQRQRPIAEHASGEFFDGGSSFPSGHSANAWSLATVVACEYGDHRPLVRVAAYGAATAVSLSRFSGRKHFLSDVVVGSAIGYAIGRFVYKRHHDTSLDDEAATSSHRGCRPF